MGKILPYGFVVQFSNWKLLGRGALVVEATEIQTNQKWVFITAHLESMKEYGREVSTNDHLRIKTSIQRMQQFDKILELAEQFNHSKVVFGGDFNMRDKEMRRLLNRRLANRNDFFQENIVDTWDNSEENRYTWDLGEFLDRKDW